ncbi:MAG: RNA polymerase sigma-70 factor, partial [Chloroflexi bacterium]
MNMKNPTETFETYRPLLFSIAYRMLGSVMEAEDIVQEAYLRFHTRQDIKSPRAFLSTIVVRLCLDYLKSAKTKREHYLGTW